MKCIIVDDEKKARTLLVNLIRENFANIEIAAMADSVDTAIEAIRNHRPELVFLDVQLKKETSFDVLEKIGKIDFEIIFITGYDNYAIRAIKFAALDYLLKPVDIEGFKNAVHKAEQEHDKKKSRQQLEVLVYNHRQPAMKKISLPSASGYLFVKLNEIVRCRADDAYTTFFFTNGKKLLVSKTLKTVEELLQDEKNFLRVHQSHLINLNYVKQYFRGDGGEVKMEDDTHIPVSRTNKDKLMKLLSIS